MNPSRLFTKRPDETATINRTQHNDNKKWWIFLFICLQIFPQDVTWEKFPKFSKISSEVKRKIFITLNFIAIRFAFFLIFVYTTNSNFGIKEGQFLAHNPHHTKNYHHSHLCLLWSLLILHHSTATTRPLPSLSIFD